MTSFYFKGCFIVLKDGLLIFYDRNMIDWKSLAKSDLDKLTTTFFENPTINELFLTGLLENLKDLNTNSDIYTIRFIFKTESNENNESAKTNLGVKFIDKDELKKLENKSELKKFCTKILT